MSSKHLFSGLTSNWHWICAYLKARNPVLKDSLISSASFEEQLSTHSQVRDITRFQAFGTFIQAAHIKCFKKLFETDNQRTDEGGADHFDVSLQILLLVRIKTCMPTSQLCITESQQMCGLTHYTESALLKLAFVSIFSFSGHSWNPRDEKVKHLLSFLMRNDVWQCLLPKLCVHLTC